MLPSSHLAHPQSRLGVEGEKGWWAPWALLFSRAEDRWGLPPLGCVGVWMCWTLKRCLGVLGKPGKWDSSSLLSLLTKSGHVCLLAWKHGHQTQPHYWAFAQRPLWNNWKMSAHPLVWGRKAARTTCIYCTPFFLHFTYCPEFLMCRKMMLFSFLLLVMLKTDVLHFLNFSDYWQKLAINRRKGVI